MPRYVTIYPCGPGERVTLRAEPDWDRAVTALEHSAERQVFELEVPDGVRQLKPVLERDGAALWNVGANTILRADQVERTHYPCFVQDSGRMTGRMRVACPSLDDALDVRVFLPPGYDENTRKRYPVLYAADGANLFDPEESAFGQEWALDETVELLDRMSVIDKIIVVGVYARPGLRNADYTLPGYEALGRALAGELVPKIDRAFRTLPTPERRAVMGSSLGGVFALHAWWAHRDTFGGGAALSATFGYADDLFERVAVGSPPPGRFYLDSGYPRDNFEAVRKMAALLAVRGANTQYFGHPRGVHSELAWADRLHLPLEFLFG